MENRGGFLWVNKAQGHFVDLEIALPDNPDWQSFKFPLKGIEKMDRAGWEAFMKAQIQKK